MKELKRLVLIAFGGDSPLLPYTDNGAYREQAGMALLTGKS